MGMSRVWAVGDGSGQQALLPVDAGAWLPAGHPAVMFLESVARLDVSAFEARYRADGRGRPPYPPRSMLALILYCRSKGLMSGRAVAAACHDDLGARLIMGNRYPDRSTIDAFGSVHAEAIRGLLPQTLRLGHAEGLVDVSVLAGDGTKVLASAAIGATVGEDALRARLDELDAELDAAEALWRERVLTGVADGLWDPGTGKPDTLPRRPGTSDGEREARRRIGALAGMRARRAAALAELAERPSAQLTEWRQRLDRDQDRVDTCAQRLTEQRAAATARQQRRQDAAATGKRLPGSAPAGIEDDSRVRRARTALNTATRRAARTAADRPVDRINTTDPASRIMPGKHDGYAQRHNVQALAGRNQFVIAIGTHPNANDKQALSRLITQGRTNLDTAGITDTIGTVLMDNGYASNENFTTELPCDLLLVAVTNEHLNRTTNPEATYPSWQTMADRFTDPTNRALYRHRAAIIEPLFAQLFARFGRALHPRGNQVDTELHLWATTHNLLKIGRKRRSPP